MPKSDLPFASDGYAPVAERIRLFYEQHPDGRILTHLVKRDGREVVFRAAVFRRSGDTRPAATGWAAEREGDGDVNTVACLENTETSAIGRALANLGFTASPNRPSAEEMQKAGRARAWIAARRERFAHITTRAPAASSGGTPLDAIVDDVLALLDQAARAGMRPARAARYRDWLASHPHSPAELERAERVLRRWLTHHASAPDWSGV